MRAAITVMALATGLAACGNQGTGGEPETTRMDAVEVPKGTISDEIMPLDSRGAKPTASSEDAASSDNSNTATRADENTQSTESESEE